MLLWFVATIVTATACAALYYAAAGRTVNEATAESAPANRHFQLTLAGIDADTSNGLLGEAEALAARKELARELLRQKADAAGQVMARLQFGKAAMLAAVAAVAVIAFAVYGFEGSPNLVSQPAADTVQADAGQADLQDALTRVEAQLKAKPDDQPRLRAVATVYTKMGRYADAEQALRKLISLGDQTAAARTDLAEALLMQKQGDASGEPMTLLQSAVALDPADPRSRFYIAGELTRAGDYAAAIPAWQALLALSKGGEPWLETAQQGLRFAQADGAPAPETAPTPATPDGKTAGMINGMVGGLADRLNASGGSVEEWTRLVRSYLVLGDKASAQSAYNKAVTAYPKTFDRGELDSIAAEGALTLTGATK